MSVVEDNRATGVKHVVVSKRNNTACRRNDRCSLSSGDVDAVMGSTRFAIVNALAAVNARNGADDWPDKAVKEVRTRVIACARGDDLSRVLSNARELVLRRCHRALRHAFDSLYVVLARLNFELVRNFGSVLFGDFQYDARPLISIKTDEEHTIFGHSNRLRVDFDCGSRLRLSNNQSTLNGSTCEHEVLV